MKVASIVGARPQFIKAAVVSSLLRRKHEEVLIHTGQHYDENMSEVFFDVLGLPKPDLNLGIGSGSHGHQTGRMLEAVEAALMEIEPDVVLVYGDTNSTLAGTLAAVKLQIETAHVEAGVRSFNMAMPEEVNRVLVDRIADYLFCPTEKAVHNLRREGVQRGVYLVGDVMYDALLQHTKQAKRRHASKEFAIEHGGYILLTIHRPANADHPKRLGQLLKAIAATSVPTIFPAHPRTRKVMDESKLDEEIGDTIRIIEPQDYLTFLSLLMEAGRVVTDSGGVQKEAYVLGVPCVTLRKETEWEETLEDGWNTLVGSSPTELVRALQSPPPSGRRKSFLGDGKAAQRIVETLERPL